MQEARGFVDDRMPAAGFGGWHNGEKMERKTMDDELFEEELDTVVMTDDETGEEIEFAILDHLEERGEKYLLVIETEAMQDDDVDALILKEMADEDDELTYAFVEDDLEFDRIADLFQKNSEEYDIRTED